MKTHPLLMWVAIVAMALEFRLAAAVPTPSAADVPPARFVIGLSPFLEKGVKDDVFRKVAGFVLEGMPVGSSLGIYDAYRLQTVATVTIPEAKVFRSGRTRANQFKDELNRLKRFLADGTAETDSNGLPPGAAVVRLPQFLDFISDNLRPSPLPLVVLVLGCPLYVDPKEPGYSMVDGYFPSDGHLLAGRDQTVFGIREREYGMSNSVVHLGYFGDPWMSDVHRERIARFWSLYAARRGSRLGTLTADLPTVFAALGNGMETAPSAPAYTPLDPSQTKIEMIRITRDPGVADWITRDTLPDHPQPPPVSERGPMRIGIRWTGAIDLDLYASPGPGAETLFFEHPQSPEGNYFKDHRSSPLREYEFIEFSSPVDVRRVEARINYFAGTTRSGPSGEVRIEFGGRIYSGPFTLAARHGNEGREGKSQAAHWAVIDVPAILGLVERERTGTVRR